MRKIIPLFMIVLAAALTGCAAMEKQKKIEAQMENLVFNAPAADVYNAAVDVMKKAMWVDVKSTGKNKGASDWVTKDAQMQMSGKKYQEKTRVRVEVAAKGKNQSTIRVYTERMTNFMGKFENPTVGRAKHYEYLTLQKIDAAKAAEVEKAASK